jgi:hypothetical protein
MLRAVQWSVVFALALLAGGAPAAGTSQSHDLDSFVFFALHELRTKGISLTGGNIGVNEPAGILWASSHGEIDAPASQVIADTVRASDGSRCATGGFFANTVVGTAGCGPATKPSLPIIADPAGACGFPTSFPACNGAASVFVFAGATRLLSAASGPYGSVVVMSGGNLVLGGGSYVFCSLRAGRDASITALRPSSISVVGDVNLSNGTFVGSDPSATPPVNPRDLKIFVNGGSVHFSGSSDVHARLCAPNAYMRITHGSDLQGLFMARTLRTERISGTPPPASGSTTTTTTHASSTTTHASTTTTHAATTTTTHPTSSCGPDSAKLCGNGRIDCNEQCDGTDFGDATCPGGSTQGLRCNPDCTIDTGNCGKPVEICGNCIDDDGNGLTDFEDPACCPQAQTFTMSVTRGRIRPRGANSKLVVHSLLAASGLENVNPLKEDVFIQIRQPGGSEILCAKAPAAKFMRMHGAFKFWDRKHQVASARGIQDVKVKVKKKNRNVRFRTFGKKVQFQTPPHGSLQITVGFHDPTSDAGNACSSQVQPFRVGRKLGLKAP